MCCILYFLTPFLPMVFFLALQLITDVNLAVSVEATQAIGNLARGLRAHFSGNARMLLPVLLVRNIIFSLTVHCHSIVLLFLIRCVFLNNKHICFHTVWTLVSIETYILLLVPMILLNRKNWKKKSQRWQKHYLKRFKWCTNLAVLHLLMWLKVCKFSGRTFLLFCWQNLSPVFMSVTLFSLLLWLFFSLKAFLLCKHICFTKEHHRSLDFYTRSLNQSITPLSSQNCVSLLCWNPICNFDVW